MTDYVKKALESNLKSFGGIDKVLSDFKTGKITLHDIANMIGVSRASASSELMSVFGSDKFKEALSERRLVISLRKIIQDINEGGSAILPYNEALSLLEDGAIKQIKVLRVYKTIFELARPIIGKPTQIIFATSHRIRSIQGMNGNVKISYAEPNENLAEYKKNFYRFKIYPRLLDKAKAIIFCLNVNNKCSYYIFPYKDLLNIQSLNLKFDNHDRSKFVANLARIELI